MAIWGSFYLFSLIVCGAVLYVIKSIRTYWHHEEITKREGCKPLRCLPNKWFPPLGLDKLRKVIKAEKARAYPLLMHGDHEKYGDTYAQWGGPVYTVITRDPRNLRVILSRQFKNFEVGPGRHGCLAPLLGDGIFTQDGLKWEHSRKLLAPMIQRPTLPDLELVERHFQRLLSKIAMTPESSEGGDPSGHWRLNVKGLLFDLSLEITTEFLLGEPPADGSLDGRKPEASVWTDDFANEFNTAFRWISKRERLKGFYWMIDSKEFRSSCKSARRIVDEIVHRSMKAVKLKHKSTESYIAMEPLLRDELEVSMIRDQFLNLLLAGRDTSGSLLCWLFYSLSREPELFTSLKTEMTELLGRNHTRKPTKSDLNRMKRLDQFISETLRVFPPVPIDCRFSVQTTTLPHGGGDDGESPILIPKGTLIAFSTFATHHSRKLYGDDADRFRIDRWVDDSVKERRMIDWSYHPFIGGPRKCLGERFALIQAKYLTCRILQHFDEMVATDCNGRTLQCGPGGSWVDDVKYHVGLTMSPDEGVWLRLRSAM